MGKIVDLEFYRNRALEERAFAPWKNRFSEEFGHPVYLSDLSDATLMSLAQPGEGGAMAYYELIMAALDMGVGTKFYYLDKGEQLRVVDIHLFLADQVRFELMRRLGWVESYLAVDFPMVVLITDFERLKEMSLSSPPRLARGRPDYEKYQQLTPREQESFIRRLLPEALESFRRQIT